MDYSYKSCAIRRGVAGALLCLLGSAAALAQNVTTHRYDNSRVGNDLQETVLTAANVNPATFGKLYSFIAKGQVYAQPLVMSGLAIPGKGTLNVAYVADAANNVSAIDIDNNGAIIWQKNFGVPVHPCDVEWHENITQGAAVGIIGTPVIDPTTNTLYFVSRNESNFDPTKCAIVPGSGGEPSGDNTAAVYTQFLNALDLTTGATKFGSPVQITATFQTASGTLTFNPRIQNQRSALALANGSIYIAYSSHDDLGAYHGWVLRYNAATLAQQNVYVDTPTGALGGIWSAGNAPAVDAAGNIYVLTGNGDFTGGSTPGATNSQNTGNSFVKLSAALQLLDWFTPLTSQGDNEADADLGASGAVLIPNTSVVIGGGKPGVAFLVNTNDMGHLNTSKDQVIQEFQECFGKGTQHIHGDPTYFASPTAGPLIYIWCENDVLRAFSFNPSTQQVITTPVATSFMTAPVISANSAMPGGFSIISADGANNNANAILWSSTPDIGDASQATVPGVAYAFDANTLNLLWSSRMNPTRDDIGNFAKYVPPVVANGKVLVADFGPVGAPDGVGGITVYGLLPAGGAGTPLVKDGTYVISSVNSALVLDDPAASMTSGTVIQQFGANSGTNQSWKLQNISPNIVSLINVASGMALSVAGDSSVNSAQVIQTPFTGDMAQEWTLVSAGSTGDFEVLNLRSGLALDVTGQSTAPGTPLDQFQYQGNPWQQWSFH
jgi:hypothetical protein